MLSHVRLEDLKRAMKKLERDLNLNRRGKKREYYLSGELINPGNLVEFLQNQNKQTSLDLKDENKKCLEFLYDKNEEEKYGLNARKENKEKMMQWADKAYPKRDIVEFEIQFEKKFLLEEMQKR